MTACTCTKWPSELVHMHTNVRPHTWLLKLQLTHSHDSHSCNTPGDAHRSCHNISLTVQTQTSAKLQAGM